MIWLVCPTLWCRGHLSSLGPRIVSFLQDFLSKDLRHLGHSNGVTLLRVVRCVKHHLSTLDGVGNGMYGMYPFYCCGSTDAISNVSTSASDSVTLVAAYSEYIYQSSKEP